MAPGTAWNEPVAALVWPAAGGFTSGLPPAMPTAQHAASADTIAKVLLIAVPPRTWRCCSYKHPSVSADVANCDDIVYPNARTRSAPRRFDRARTGRGRLSPRWWRQAERPAADARHERRSRAGGAARN